MNKEEQFLTGRFLDMAERTYRTDRPVFSEFLNLNEQNVLLSIVNQLPPVNYELVGGYIYSERKLLRFSSRSYDDSNISAPISVIRCEPVNPKFADKLTHRDYLGSIMNLGINRNTIGDFIIKDNLCYIICLDSISEYILQNLTKVKHTLVKTELADICELDMCQPKLTEMTGFVASNRVDSIISMVFNMSRSGAGECISQGNVFVNSRQINSRSVELKEKDIVSVRGTGRFIFNQVVSTTKKNRLMISISRY